MGKHLLFKIAILASLLCTSAWAQTQAVARVAVSVGEARKFNAAGQAEPLQVGSSLMAGDRIRTGPDGVAILVFTDEGRISLRSDSELLIRHYEIDPSGVKTRIELELLKGTVRQISGNASRAQPERYRLNTPVAVIGVRGTDFLAKTAGDSVEAFVHEGKIVFTPAASCAAQADCAPVVMASSDTPLRYIRLSTDGRIEQREFRQGELERVFGIEVARNGHGNGNNPLAAAPGRRLEGSEGQQLPEGTRLISPTIFAAYTKAEAEVVASVQAARTEETARQAQEAAQQAEAARIAEAARQAEATRQAESARLAEAARLAALATPAAVEMPKQLVWGRFTGASTLPANFVLSYDEARQGRHVTVGELGQYALWRANPSGRMSDALKGEASFRLASAEALLVQASGVSPAQVTSASLNVNFDKSTFTAGVGLQHALTGPTAVNVSGRVNDEGIFVGTTATDRVAGALTRDGTEAGYLFSKDVAAGQLRGITLWKR